MLVSCLQRIPENQDNKAAKGLGLQIIFGLMRMESDKMIDTAKEAVALIGSIIVIIMALGGIGLIYNVFARLE